MSHRRAKLFSSIYPDYRLNMLIFKLSLLALLFLAFLFFSSRLLKKGISQRYEPKAQTSWNALNEGKDPTL